MSGPSFSPVELDIEMDVDWEMIDLPRLAQLFHRISAKCKNNITMLEHCEYEYLVSGVVVAYAWPGSLSSLPYSRMARVDRPRLDGI